MRYKNALSKPDYASGSDTGYGYNNGSNFSAGNGFYNAAGIGSGSSPGNGSGVLLCLGFYGFGYGVPGLCGSSSIAVSGDNITAYGYGGGNGSDNNET
jgi:hypothetical protein